MKKATILAVLMLVLMSAVRGQAQKPDPIFHGIRLGVSPGSQFKECPWNPPKEGDIPNFISPPDKDNKGNTIPCFHAYVNFFQPAASPQVVSLVQLYEHLEILKDAQGNVSSPEPLPGLPKLSIQLLVPANTPLLEGTIEEVGLVYHPLEADRVRDSLIKKFGASHPPDKKVNPKIVELMLGGKLISNEVWETAWGELRLAVTDKQVVVVAQTSKLIRFNKQNEKDEF